VQQPKAQCNNEPSTMHAHTSPKPQTKQHEAHQAATIEVDAQASTQQHTDQHEAHLAATNESDEGTKQPGAPEIETCVWSQGTLFYPFSSVTSTQTFARKSEVIKVNAVILPAALYSKCLLNGKSQVQR
jgi:hypothetical protein